MCEKRRIRKRCVGWAVRSKMRRGVPTLFPLKVGLRFAWPSLLLLVVLMGGCSVANSPWQYNSRSLKVATQADLATFNEAVALVESQRYEEAVAKFRQVFDNFASSNDRQRAAESLFWIGFCREKQRRLDEARVIYLRLAKEYVGTRAAKEAYKRRLRLPVGGANPSDVGRR